MTVYVGLEHELCVQFEDASQRIGRLVAIEPYRKHRIVAGRQFVCTVLVEPESTTDASLEELLAVVNAAPSDTAKVADLFDFLDDLSRHTGNEAPLFSRLDFDRLVFGHDLETRVLDQRIRQVAGLIERDLENQPDTESCAREISVTASRFRRLFRESTGVQFRYYRMWKRARSYLRHIESPASLTQTALALGYPDSTHFSHSIRQTYGLPPLEMKKHMKQSIFFGDWQADPSRAGDAA